MGVFAVIIAGKLEIEAGIELILDLVPSGSTGVCGRENEDPKLGLDGTPCSNELVILKGWT